MTSCRSARAAMLRELDRALSVDDALALEEHLSHCAACRAISERASVLEEQLHALAQPPIERLELERNVRAIRERIAADAGPSRAQRTRRIAVPAGLAAVALLILWAASRRASPPDASSLDRATPPVLEIASATVAAPLDDEPAFDAVRLAAARDELRQLFAAAAASLPPLASEREARAMADAIDAARRNSALSTWPVLRIAAGIADDADPAVARTVLRYLGVRGDRLTLPAIEERARGGDPREAVLALLDLGDEGCEALARALRQPELAAFAVEQLARWPAERAVRALDLALRRGPATDSLLDALPPRGAPAVAAIVALERDRAIPRERALDLLAATPDAANAFGELLAAPSSVGDELAFEVCARLQPRNGIAWLAARCREPRTRSAAVSALAAYDDAAALDAALDLARERWIGAEDLGLAVRAGLARDPQALADFSSACIAADSGRAATLLDALVDSANPAACASLLVFVASDELAEEERELAARAVGDLGEPEVASELAATLARLDTRHRRLAAACVDAIHRLGGDDAVSVCLAGVSRRCTERVLTVLRQRSPQSVSLVQLARALDPLLDRGPNWNPPTHP